MTLECLCYEMSGHGRDNHTPVFQATGCGEFTAENSILFIGGGNSDLSKIVDTYGRGYLLRHFGRSVWSLAYKNEIVEIKFYQGV